MKQITAWLYEWGEIKAQELAHNPYPDTNILHRFSIEGEVQSPASRDKILCFDSHQSREVIDINRAWNSLSRRPKLCILGKYAVTNLLKDDGNPYTAREVAELMSINFDTFKENVSRGRRSIQTKITVQKDRLDA